MHRVARSGRLWRIAWLGLALLGPGATSAATPPARPAAHLFDERDGLPQNSVEALALDADGFLWAGTQDGAARYEGGSWTVVSPPEGQRSNWVTALLPGAEGMLLGTMLSGLHLWRDGEWIELPKGPGGRAPHGVGSLSRALDGTVWVGTQDEGLWRLGPGGFTRQDGLDARRVNAVLEEPESLWAGTDQGLFVRRGGAWEHQGPVTSINDLLRDGDSIWVATAQGLYRMRAGQFVPQPFAGSLVGTSRLARGPGLDGRPSIWASTDRGVAVGTGDGDWRLLGLKEGLPSLVSHSLLVAANDSGPPLVWAGTFAGLVRWTLGRFNRVEWPTDLTAGTVFAIKTTSDGATWLGMVGPALLRIRDGTSQAVTIAKGPPMNNVLSLEPDGERLWVGTKEQGLALWEKGELRWWEHNRELPNNSVYALARSEEAGKSLLWLGTRKGLLRWDGEELQLFGLAEGLPNLHVNTLLPTRSHDGQAELWIGTRGGGLAVLRGGRIEAVGREQGVAPMVMGLAEQRRAAGGRYLWVACPFGGAFRFDPDLPAGPWLHLDASTQPPLPSSTVYQVQVAPGDKVFFFTSKGVARLDQAESDELPTQLATYTTADGLPSNGCTMGSSHVEGTRVWTGTVTGAAFLDLLLDHDDRTPKPLHLIRAERMGGKPLLRGEALDHQTGRLHFVFSLLDYRRESDVRYRVQLLGLETEPSPWIASNTVDYSVLPAGAYTLRVFGRDHAGNLSGPIDFPFSVRPAPWLHPLAFVAYLCLAAALALAAHRWRSQLLRARNQALQARVTLATQEIRQQAQQLEQLNQRKNEFMAIAAHDLRNPLSGIVIEAEMMADERDPESVELARQRILENAKVMQELISRLLNANAIEEGEVRADLRAVDLRPIAADVAARHSSRARQKEIHLDHDLGDGPLLARADPHLVREVLDNLLSNALKFSPSGRRVLLRAERVNGSVTLSVVDEGPGLTEEDKKKMFGRYVRLSARPSAGEPSVGLGLCIVKQMVDAMDGRIVVDSEVGKGARFSVELHAP